MGVMAMELFTSHNWVRCHRRPRIDGPLAGTVIAGALEVTGLVGIAICVQWS